MLRQGMVWAAVCACAGCTFDSSGALPSAATDGGTAGAADARPLPPDARPSALPDATARPDAAPVEQAGTVRARRGAIDMFDDSFADWGDAPVYSFDINSGMDFHSVEGYSPSATLIFSSMHDAEFIYFALIVEDNQVLPAVHPMWEDDSIAIYLDAAGDGAGPFGGDDHEIIIGSDGPYRDYAPDPADAVLHGSTIATTNGYALEIGVRKDSLGVGTLPGVIGFDIAIHDDDTDGDAAFGLWFRDSGPSCADCCTSFEHPEAWCDTTIFGSLILE